MLGTFGDKKNNAQIIISKLKLGGEKEQKMDEPKKENGFIPKIAEEMIAAIEAKNPESLAQSLKSFIYACKEEEEGYEEKEDSDEAK